MGKGCGIIVLAAIAFVAFAMWNGEQDDAKFDPAQAARPIVALTVPEFQAAWADNELAAKQRFEANRLRITGKIESVAVNLTNDAVLHLAGGDPLKPMTAHFLDSEQPKLAALAPGQKVTVLCGRGVSVMDIPAALDCRLE